MYICVHINIVKNQNWTKSSSSFMIYEYIYMYNTIHEILIIILLLQRFIYFFFYNMK